MKKIKLFIKESYGGIFISLLLSFMFMVYEPLNMFQGNMSDFWFDIYHFFPIIMEQFLITFAVLFLFFIIVRRINIKVYRFCVACAFIGTISLYIQGNYLIGGLPPIDGGWIDFDPYKTEKMISIILWIVVAGLTIFGIYKFKFEKFEKTSMYISLAIIAMMFISAISFVTQPHFFDSKKNQYIATYENISKVSTDKNFMIFLLDAADSKTFDQELGKYYDKNELLKDFTYFPNTTSTYIFTMFSIPYLLGGTWYENERDFHEWVTESIDNSLLFSELEKQGYQLNLYEDGELSNYTGNKLNRFKNMTSEFSIDKKELIKQELQYSLFKYLPYQLKGRTKAYTINLNRTKLIKSNDDNIVYSDSNLKTYKHLLNDKIEKIDDKYFQFVHVQGAHSPFEYNKELEIVNNGSFIMNVDASTTMLEQYLKRLRESDAYDNSVIMIIADHGWSDNDIERSNPILYIKGFNEKHDYKVSNKKVSFKDYNDAYIDLMNGKSSDELFENVDNDERRFLFCHVFECGRLTEMIQKGDSWDASTIVETGKVYGAN